MNWPATMISQVQKMTGPPSPKPTPKLPNDPVETLMKLNARAKFDEEAERPRSAAGLMPSDSRCASSRAAMSWADSRCPDTVRLPTSAPTGASCPLG